jgi:pyruvate dehydrogenase E2 component (dihydrolipoamide acetyltransferase)
MAEPTGPTTEFRMPSLGADMTEGRVVEWLVTPGQVVQRGEIVAVVETDKSDIEVEVFAPGVIAELLVAEGETVEVGTPIARITEAVTMATGEMATPAVAAPVTSRTATVETAGPAAGTPRATLTSPLIRRLAADLHVDAAGIHGSGPGGRICRDDVVAAGHPPRRRRITPRARRLMRERGIGEASFVGVEPITGAAVIDAAPHPAATTDRLGTPRRASGPSAMRARIAELMTRSWSEIPHYHVTRRLDLGAMMRALTERNASYPVAGRVLPAAVLLCAAARAGAAVPDLNGWYRGGALVRSDGVQLGVVLSLRDGGIVVPTITAADTLTTTEMMQRLTELVERARRGRLRSSDLTEASLTVTNLGDRGAESVVGVIHPPQVALIGYGAIHDEVWPHRGGTSIRPTTHATLSGDHRATDGATGSRLLGHLQQVVDTIIDEETS